SVEGADYDQRRALDLTEVLGRGLRGRPGLHVVAWAAANALDHRTHAAADGRLDATLRGGGTVQPDPGLELCGGVPVTRLVSLLDLREQRLFLGRGLEVEPAQSRADADQAGRAIRPLHCEVESVPRTACAAGEDRTLELELVEEGNQV